MASDEEGGGGGAGVCGCVRVDDREGRVPWFLVGTVSESYNNINNSNDNNNNSSSNKQPEV